MALDAVLIGTRGTTSGSSVTTTAGTSTGGSGNHGLIFVSADPGVTVSSVSDSKGNTWSLQWSANAPTFGDDLYCYKCENWTGGASHTATVSFSGTSYAVAHLVEVTGALSSSPIDVSTTSTTPSSTATGALAQADELILSAALMNVGAAGGYASSNLTVLSQEPDTGSFWTSAVGKLVVSSTSSVNVNWSRTNSDGTGAVGIVTFKAAAAAPSPSISGTSTATPSHTGTLTITGTNFGASQGSGSVTIGGVTQTVTAWADSSITVTVSRGTNKYGAAVNVVVTDNALNSSSPYALTSLLPQSGWDYVDIGTPNATAAYRITASGDIASGDQIAWETLGGDVEVFSDGTFSADAGTVEFDVEVWTPVDGWGSTATQRFVQLAVPTSDVSEGTWTPSAGADLYAVLDESAPSDADFISTNTAADSCVVALGALGDPASSAGHIVSYRLIGDGVSGITVELLQGASVIATWTHDPAPTVWTTYNQTLTGTEADSITDYTALRLRFTEV